jgi:hypothetical protein
VNRLRDDVKGGGGGGEDGERDKRVRR